MIKRKKNLSRFVLLLIAVFSAFALETYATPAKVLTIGNSFSFSLTKEWPNVARESGCELDFVSLMIGGCTFDRHVNNLTATNYPYIITWDYCGDRTSNAIPWFAKVKSVYDKRGTTFKYYAANLTDIISAEEWDVITIQQGSPQSWKWGSFSYAAPLIAAIKELAPKSEIRIQQTWSYCMGDWRVRNPFTGGPGRWGITLDTMYERLTMNYARLAETNGFKVIPTGVAVQEYRRLANLTSYEGDVVGDLHKTDKVWTGTDGDPIHLNRSGEYLQALVWTGSIFGIDPLKCPYTPDYVDEAKGNLIRQAAASALKQGLPKAVDPLAGKKLVVIGDSYVRNHARPVEETWHYRFAEKHGMKYENFGVNGGMMILGMKGPGTAVAERYVEMPDDADIVLVVAGHNDAEEMSRNEPDKAIAEFEAGLPTFADNLRKKYPQAELIFVSPWKNSERKGFKKLVDIERKVLGQHDVRFFDASKFSGLDVDTADQHWELYQCMGDAAHLSAAGHGQMLERFEQFF